MQRQLVLVSGPPGAGKTTVAQPLAAELGFTLLAKDRIKETLHDWLWPALPDLAPAPDVASAPDLAPAVDLAWSQRLGSASMELLWALAADAPAAVLDANFWPDDPRLRDRLSRLTVRPVEVHCRCPAAVAERRYAARARDRHPAHAEHARSASRAAGFARSARPLGLGPVITVDTTRPVDIAALAADVRRRLDSASRWVDGQSGDRDP